MRHLPILAALCLGWGAMSAEAGTSAGLAARTGTRERPLPSLCIAPR